MSLHFVFVKRKAISSNYIWITYKLTCYLGTLLKKSALNIEWSTSFRISIHIFWVLRILETELLTATGLGYILRETDFIAYLHSNNEQMCVCFP